MRRGGQHDLTVRNGDVSLAGSLWLSAGDVVATLLMHPGSGPSDRDNDVYFPPVRTHLLEAGVAVASFDKRGVGGSTGKWEEASIVVQADDALACVDTLAGESNLGTPVGLFGHSQGGWVVLDAAARGSDAAFVISNSGPGVTPGEQERWAARSYAQRAGIPDSEILEVDRFFDFLVSMLRSHAPFEQVNPLLAAEGFPGLFDSLGLPFLPEDAAVWEFMAAIIDYDPQPALERIDVPLLAVFGGDDPIVPVAASVEIYRATVRPDLLHLEVFPGADHRIESGDPPRLATGHLETISGFVLDVVT